MTAKTNSVTYALNRSRDFIRTAPDGRGKWFVEETYNMKTFSRVNEEPLSFAEATALRSRRMAIRAGVLLGLLFEHELQAERYLVENPGNPREMIHKLVSKYKLARRAA